MTKHTPGPWRVKNSDVTGGDGTPVASLVFEPEVADSLCDANARLIAAAPDLLEALKTALPWIVARVAESTGPERVAEHPVYAAARAAIAKAEGGDAN